MRKYSSSSVTAVFINCPFDASYRPLFDAIVFAVMALGFEPRCALERDTGTQERLKKIIEIITPADLEFTIFRSCASIGGLRLSSRDITWLSSWAFFLVAANSEGRDRPGRASNPRSRAMAISKITIRPQRARPSRPRREPRARHRSRPKLASDRIAACRPARRLFHHQAVQAIQKGASKSLPAS